MRKNLNIKEHGVKSYCPRCKSDNLEKSIIEGNVNPGSEGDYWSHDLLSCKKCG